MPGTGIFEQVIPGLGTRQQVSDKEADLVLLTIYDIRDDYKISRIEMVFGRNRDIYTTLWDSTSLPTSIPNNG